MQKSNWEDSVCFVCDYWWLLLLCIMLTLTAYFTRAYWLPSQLVSTPIPTQPVEAPAITATLVIEITQTPTSAFTPEAPTQTITQTATATVLEEKTVIGFLAPNLKVKTLAGDNINSKDFIGHPVLLFVFSSWCPYCQKEAPIIEIMYKKYKDKGLVILPINNTSTDKEADVKSFAEKFDWSFGPLLDENGSSMRVYNLQAVPGNLFIDKDGVIQDIVLGAMSESDLEKSLSKIIP